MKDVNSMDLLATILMIIGGLNWGLVGLFGFNLVDAIFGVGSLLSRIVYIIVGLAAVWGVYMLTRRATRASIA